MGGGKGSEKTKQKNMKATIRRHDCGTQLSEPHLHIMDVAIIEEVMKRTATHGCRLCIKVSLTPIRNCSVRSKRSLFSYLGGYLQLDEHMKEE